MRAFEISAGSTGIDGIRSTERPTPTVTPTGILVRMRAASLNFRDLMVAAGRYAGGEAAEVGPVGDGGEGGDDGEHGAGGGGPAHGEELAG